MLVIAAFGASVIAAASAAAAARAPILPVKVPDSARPEKVVADGRSGVLLLDSGDNNHRGSITRMRLDGSVDRSFGDDGTVHLSAADAVVARDGKILVATGDTPRSHIGEERVVRLLADGSRDRSFGKGGSAYIASVGATPKRKRWR